jgi:hypothetical protein
VQSAGAALPHLADLPVRTDHRPGLGHDPLLPRRGDFGGQVQRVDAGVVPLEVAPEQPAERGGKAGQAGVVEHRLSFLQVGDE